MALSFLQRFARWLNTAGRRISDEAELISALGRYLHENGVPADRITTGVPVLHPQIFSLSILWELGSGATERRIQLDSENYSQFDNSAIAEVYRGSAAIRKRLTEPAEPGEFTILPDLRAAGFTDYLVVPMPFSDGAQKAITFTTRRPEGFTEAEVADLTTVGSMIAPLMEIRTLRRTSRTLLDTYLGPATGGRVLDGVIKRGMCERIRAVIWFCDLRGFTDLSDRLEPEAVIDLLNLYLEIVCTAIEREGGEILKFIGDAVLAIFPLAEVDPEEQVCAAVRAAKAARAALVALKREQTDPGVAELDFGVAIHVGEVMYGNIGAPNRMDFTVIGAAVNLASRLETLTKETGEPIHLSEAVHDLCASALKHQLQPIGSFALKGVHDRQVVFKISGG